MNPRTTTKRRVAVLAVVSAACGASVWAAAHRTSPDPAEQPVANAPGASPTHARWIVAGGGPTPESNEVSIEDDLRLAASVLPGPGVTLYASGAKSKAVRVQADDLPSDPLIAELGAIFSPRPGRSSRYQSTRIAADGPASPTALLDAVDAASSAPGKPLTVYIAGHGDVGTSPADNAIVMWANFTVTPIDLAKAVETSKRRTRFVITTCFSGGFAELAFVGADEKAGAAPGDVCGLFASTWDREAGGCDPDPDRGQHDGYGVHFLSALDGKKRDGTALAATTLDIDGDGVVSLLDAHTFARLSSRSIDVPTTTSERWLRHSTTAQVIATPLMLAHEDAVIGVLGPRYGGPTEPEAVAELKRLDDEIVAAGGVEAEASKAETEIYWDASAALLARWPVLDDPWHPLWREAVDTNRTEIAAFLASAPELASLSAAIASTNVAAMKTSSLEVRRAALDRVVRAFETKRLAAALSAQGGPAWDRYVALRACENSAP